jgi:voltage-gated potassium channel
VLAKLFSTGIKSNLDRPKLNPSVNKKAELFVTTITVMSVVVILIPSVYSLTPTQLNIIYIFDLMAVAILATDFYVRLRKSGQGSRFILTHCYEIPAMLPLILFAALEQDPGFIGAGIRSLRLIRLFRIIQLFFRTLKLFEGRRILYIVAFSSMAVVLGAVTEYLVESSDPQAKITNIEDAFWWAIVTVTTVGYGDLYPVTPGGKIVASMLMIIGIAILGVLISTLGAGLIESRFTREGKSRGKKTAEPSVVDETKILIKSKIDRIEDISQDDFDNLMTTIKNLRSMSHA